MESMVLLYGVMENSCKQVVETRKKGLQCLAADPEANIGQLNFQALTSSLVLNLCWFWFSEFWERLAFWIFAAAFAVCEASLLFVAELFRTLVSGLPRSFLDFLLSLVFLSFAQMSDARY